VHRPGWAKITTTGGREDWKRGKGTIWWGKKFKKGIDICPGTPAACQTTAYGCIKEKNNLFW